MITTILAVGILVSLYSVLYLYRRRGDGLQDMVTGLPSRDFFERFLQQCAARTTRKPNYGFAVLLLDIRGFTEMRKDLGRFTAEEVLADFAERVYWCIRPADVLTRLEGDNFAIVLEDVFHVTDATRVALRVHASMTEAVTLAAQQVSVEVNVGVTISKPGTQQESRTLIQEAEDARARAVQTGRPYLVFDPELDARSIEDHKMEAELASALDAGELRVVYSPFIHPSTLDLAGFTALLQWDHPRLGLLNAREFIHLAEASREILRMGHWVVSEACHALVRISEVTPRPLMISVNVGLTELERADIPNIVREHLGTSSLQASRLRVEVPALALSDIGERLELVTGEFKALGVGIQLDHLSASSIPLVRATDLGISGARLNLQAYDGADPDAPGAFLKLLATTRTLTSEIVVEGVETRGAFTFISAIEPAVLAQGSYIARPMPLARALEIASQQRPRFPRPRDPDDTHNGQGAEALPAHH